MWLHNNLGRLTTQGEYFVFSCVVVVCLARFFYLITPQCLGIRSGEDYPAWVTLFFVGGNLAGRVPLKLERGRYETDISAAQEKTEEHAWLSCADGHEERSEGPVASASQGSLEADSER